MWKLWNRSNQGQSQSTEPAAENYMNMNAEDAAKEFRDLNKTELVEIAKQIFQNKNASESEPLAAISTVLAERCNELSAQEMGELILNTSNNSFLRTTALQIYASEYDDHSLDAEIKELFTKDIEHQDAEKLAEALNVMSKGFQNNMESKRRINL